MKLIIIIFSIFTLAAAQEPSLSCNYVLFGSVYGCELTIHNTNGFDDFTEIGGIHLVGFTNDDVARLYRGNVADSTIVPKILCDTFSNLNQIQLFRIGLNEIGDDAFAGCSRLTELMLFSNNISRISENAFDNLRDVQYITLESNVLTTLPGNVFENQESLVFLYLSYNPIEDFPAGLFAPLENLESLSVGDARLTTINNEWFGNNVRLNNLNLRNNRIELSADTFNGLEGLSTLNLANNGISEISLETFAPLQNLRNLYLMNNNITELQADSFPNLPNVEILDVSENPIRVIRSDAFRGLTGVTTLFINHCGVRELHSNSFEGLENNLTYIDLSFNEIQELPQQVFAPLSNIIFLSLWNNRLKTLHRNSFGTLNSLQILDVDGNVVNALDRAIIDDAVNLNSLYFSGNLCANGHFGNFLISREQFLPMLDRCFTNMRYIVVTTTEGDAEFTFFEGPHPGIALRVNSSNEVHISLTPFNFAWTPIIEVFIGTTNNTRSTIRINQETNVATVPTPNILTRGQWNDFRVTWANQNVLVFRGNDSFPFLSYTMEHFFPVNFYGLRAVETSASWSITPFDW